MATFDDMFVSSGEDEGEGHPETAMEYLVEITELKDKIVELEERAKIEDFECKNLMDVEADNVQLLAALKKELEEKDEEFRKLGNRLHLELTKNPIEDSTALRVSDHINLDTIIARSHFILKDIEQARKTGNYGNINARITTIRKLFDNCLETLNDLNKSNKCVEKCLRILKDLDVR